MGHVEAESHRPGRHCPRPFGHGTAQIRSQPPLGPRTAQPAPGRRHGRGRTKPPAGPNSNPRRTGADTTARVLALRASLTDAGLDAGPRTIAWHLERTGLHPPSTSTIRRVLHTAGFIRPEPKKRPKTSLHRFEAHQPNETWQCDFTQWALADGTDVEILNFLDDHSRYLLACTAFKPATVTAVVTTFLACAAEYGLPASILTDNGMVYTTRFSGGRGGRNAFEHQLHALGITQKNGSPNHSQTQGKICEDLLWCCVESSLTSAKV